MIVRILGEGQYELDAAAMARVERLDATLSQALGAEDEAWFAKALDALLAEVRGGGHRLDPGTLVPSDLAVPAEGSTIDEVRALLAEGPTEPA